MDDVSFLDFTQRHLQDFSAFAGIFALRTVLIEQCDSPEEHRAHVDKIVAQWKQKQKAALTKEIQVLRNTVGDSESLDLETVQSDHVKAIEHAAQVATALLVDKPE